MAAKTRRQRESGFKDARQGLTLLALLAGIYVWYKASSLITGLVVFVLVVAAVEAVLVLPGIMRARRLQACDYDDVYAMNGEEFEGYLQALFTAKGYRVTLTPNGSDFGADLIIEKDGQQTAVQAKHWVTRDVGVTAVQEVCAARDYYHASKTMVVSVGAFTRQAIDLAGACKVELWDGRRLQSEVLAIRSRRASAGQVPVAGFSDRPMAAAAEKAPTPSCPRCGATMVRRRSKYGEFWGCSGFPGCTGTRQASELLQRISAGGNAP